MDMEGRRTATDDALAAKGTGYGRSEDRQAVREAGFDEHLVKPLNLDDLRRVLKKPR